MGFLDKPKRYLPLREEIDICDVCGSNSLKLVPCSHWKCSNCGYDTRLGKKKISELKKDYKRIRESNQKLREKRWELKKDGWVKCIDCKYNEPLTKNYLDEHVEETCYIPTYVDTTNIECGYDDKLNEYVSCSYGEKKSTKSCPEDVNK